MITGFHALMYTKQADEVRAFLRDVLGLPFVDTGHDWLIFGLPPAELGIHPAEEEGKCEMYLMCDDITATTADLAAKGVELSRPVTDEGWGLLTAIRLPGGGSLGLYEPKHQTALALSGQNAVDAVSGADKAVG
jgi:predicted enzyme related to lactoylglutathione lyase